MSDHRTKSVRVTADTYTLLGEVADDLYRHLAAAVAEMADVPVVVDRPTMEEAINYLARAYFVRQGKPKGRAK